jgi:hypothetical protein
LTEDTAPRMFRVLLPHPQAAARFMAANRHLMPKLTEETLIYLSRQTDPCFASLQKAIFEDEQVPLNAIISAGDPRFLPGLKKRLAKTPPHGKPNVAACARALGELPGRIIKISESQPGDFMPLSAQGMDPNRFSPNSHGHGDGHAWVIITGRFVMPDGSPAREPRFFNRNDRMLLGEERKDPAEIRYDSKTGRFVFCTEVFAAYSLGGGQREPGPYQTGPAVVTIEARRAKPLTVHFFDEMPDVEITLSRAQEK